jgi:hypothetical protein
MTDHNSAPIIDTVNLVNTALFYPCCGPDLRDPLRLFGEVISDFYCVDIKRYRLSAIDGFHALKSQETDTEDLVHRRSHPVVRLHRWQRRAEEVLSDLPRLGVFFFRGDYPVNGVAGERSSGVLWLGGELFPRVLDLVIPGGLVVTDGSNYGETAKQAGLGNLAVGEKELHFVPIMVLRRNEWRPPAAWLAKILRGSLLVVLGVLFLYDDRRSLNWLTLMLFSIALIFGAQYLIAGILLRRRDSENSAESQRR